MGIKVSAIWIEISFDDSPEVVVVAYIYRRVPKDDQRWEDLKTVILTKHRAPLIIRLQHNRNDQKKPQYPLCK